MPTRIPEEWDSQGNAGLDILRNLVLRMRESNESTAIHIADLIEVQLEGASITGIGHAVAVLGHAVMSALGETVAQAIGTEGKLTVSQGTVTTGQAMQANLELSGGTVSTAYGLLALLNNLAAAVGTVRGVGVQFGSDVSGVTGNIEGVTIVPPSGAGGNGFIGLQVANDPQNRNYSIGLYLTLSGDTNGRRSIRSDGSSPMVHTGRVTFGSGNLAASGYIMRLDGAVQLQKIAEPASPPAGFVALYADSADGEVKAKDSAGNVVAITSGLIT